MELTKKIEKDYFLSNDKLISSHLPRIGLYVYFYDTGKEKTSFQVFENLNI